MQPSAADEIAARSDVVVVIGGAHSNNTRELVATCGKACRRVHHVQTAADLRADWFLPDDTVGITAGTSTPDAVIDAVEAWLRERATACAAHEAAHAMAGTSQAAEAAAPGDSHEAAACLA